MRFKSLVAVVLVLCVLCVSVADGAITSFKPYDIAHVTDACYVMAVGRVVGIEYVERDDFGLTTDVTLKVSEMIKGETNAGKNRLKFMVLGGVGEYEGEPAVVRVSDTPTFDLNEKVLVMFDKHTMPGLVVPYGGMFPFQGTYCKRAIDKDDNVLIRYTFGNDDDRGGAFYLPIDLVVTIAKAAVKDKDATVLVEKDLKDKLEESVAPDVELTESFVDDLNVRLKKILDKQEEEE